MGNYLDVVIFTITFEKLVVIPWDHSLSKIMKHLSMRNAEKPFKTTKYSAKSNPDVGEAILLEQDLIIKSAIGLIMSARIIKPKEM